jgi:hypothetical protein
MHYRMNGLRPPSLEQSERRGLFFVIPVNLTFEQSENVAIEFEQLVAEHIFCAL